MIVRSTLPRTIERGVTTTLTLDVYSDASVQQTIEGTPPGTVTITAGSTAIVSAGAVTASTPATYSLAGSVTEGLGLSDRWLEVWSVTVGSTPYLFRQPAMLVRHAFHPTITDQDLTSRHSDLLDSSVLPAGLTSYETYRTAASEMIQRALLRKGRRPWLIFDAWELVDAHISATLALIFDDLASSIGDGRYRILARGEDGRSGYHAEWVRQFEGCQFRYDESETGTIDTNDTVTTSPVVTLSAGRPGVHRYSGRGIGYPGRYW
jgi:hypothetical protein